MSVGMSRGAGEERAVAVETGGGERAAQVLDITREVCPMTYVRTKLALERVPPGALLEVHLRGAEPLRNVPRSAREEGHEVVALEPLEPPGAVGGVHRLLLRRRGGG